MRTHTSDFKNAISRLGRQIKGRIYYYNNYNLNTEDDNLLLTENNLQLISEQINEEDKVEIDNENINQISIIKNGNLFQSLMKELDFEAKIELNIGTVVNPQLGVLIDEQNDTYEYIDYNNFIIKEKEYNLDTKSWNYVCYDKMLYSMKLYKAPKVTFPISIGNYLKAIANEIGLDFQKYALPTEETPFITIEPANYDELVYEELFEGLNLTYRDVFDKFAEIFGGNLLIHDDGYMTCVYPSQIMTGINFVDTFNEENIKDISTSFNKKFGPVNKVSMIDTESNLEFISQDIQSINTNGVTQITITDNPLSFNGNSQEIANNILQKWLSLTNGFYYCDFSTTGLCYYDYLDYILISLSADFDQYNSGFYPILILNNEVTITQGLEEKIFNDETEQTKQRTNDDYVTSIINSKDTSFEINKQNNEIKSKVSKDGVISAINQSSEEIQIQAKKIKLEGYTTINEGFSIDEQGNMTANNGVFNGLINAGKIKVSGYTEGNPYFEAGDLDGDSPYGLIIWDNGLSVVDYRGEGYEPLIRTEQINGGYAQLKGNHVDAFAFNNVSLAEKKKDFELLKSGLEIIKDIDVYKYHYKDSNDKKKKIGVVIGDNYNYSKEITNDDNTEIDLYSFIAVCCKAIQEQQEEINELKEMIKNGKY